MRTREIPVKVSEDELAEIRRQATEAKMTIADWVRRRLKLPKARRGRPAKPVMDAA